MDVFDLNCTIRRYDEATEAGKIDAMGDELSETEWPHFREKLAEVMQKRLNAQGKDTFPNGMTPREVVYQIWKTLQLCHEKDIHLAKRLINNKFDDKERHTRIWLLTCSAALYEMAASGKLTNCPADIDPALLFMSTMNFWGWHDKYRSGAELDLIRMNGVPRQEDRVEEPYDSRSDDTDMRIV